MPLPARSYGTPAAAVNAAPSRAPLLSQRAILAAALITLALAVLVANTLPTAPATAPATAHSRGFVDQGLVSLPLAAQGAASRALGDSPAYRIRTSPRGLSATNRAQRLGATFGSTMVSVGSGATHVGLRLAGIGYGSALAAIGSAAPRARANRVTYDRPGLEEWYANGPLGLEQGFTIARAPSGYPGAPLTLALALSGNASASLDRGGRSVTLSHPGSSALHYTSLTATDATGRTLRSWLALAHGRLLVQVDAAAARYPLRIDPFVQQAKLTKNCPGGGTALGAKVALSSDGNTALVGAPNCAVGETNPGAAVVLTRAAGVWSEQETFVRSGSNTEFGSSVALSSDGNTALIGEPHTSGEVGRAWVFTRSAGKWSEQAELTGSGETGNGRFGGSAALSSDGNTALIGGAGDHEHRGAAWVFTRSAGKWSQQGSKLTSSEEEGEGLWGFAVSLSSDGNTALVGAPNDSPGSVARAGSVTVLTRSGGVWGLQGKELQVGEGKEGYFGASVALSGNGNTGLVGATGGGTQEEPAYAFTRSAGAWRLQAEFKGTGETSTSNFGDGVALSEDGNTALVGGSNDTSFAGAAWAFARSAEKWTQSGEKLVGAEEVGKGAFGESVALSADASTALIGGPADSASAGAAWVFINYPTVETKPATAVTATTATLNASVNPHGEESECAFQYGVTTAYGSSAACSPAVPKGEGPMAVTAALSGLAPNTVYHFRIEANNKKGLNFGADQTFTTLATSASAETKSSSEPAKATDGALSVEGSGGTGAVTIGPYGSNVGGPALVKGQGAYIQAYRSSGATFTKMEIKDCELGGAKTLWWDNPATGWEAIAEPPARYTPGATPCIAVTITEKTSPSLAQMTDPRYRGGPSGAQEYGKCEPQKHGYYTEGACLTVALKKGIPSFKGKFEWYPSPVACFAKKHGRYSDGGCTALDEPKGKPKGKYERGVNGFTASGGAVKFEVQGSSAIECTSSSAEGQPRDPKQGIERITYTGCKRLSATCQSAGEKPGTIRTYPLESYTYEEAGKIYTVLGGNPIAVFLCANVQFVLSGVASGEVGGDLNAMSATSQSTFKAGVGEQALSISEGTGASMETTLTSSMQIAVAQPLELKTRP